MRIGIVYSSNSINTSKVAKMLSEQMHSDHQMIGLENATFDALDNLDVIFVGVSTWFDGELPAAWDEYLPGIEEKNFSGKYVAIFGLGDQKKYPEHYQDAMGILATFFEQRGATLVGFTSTDGYDFEASQAVRNSQFCGLALDATMNDEIIREKIHAWLQDIFKTLNSFFQSTPAS